MSEWEYQAGEIIHGFELAEPLGSGGSGEVWLATAEDNTRVALKILISRELCKILRFVREIEIMEAINARIALPIYPVVLPGCNTPPACYTMPLAVPIKKHIKRARSGPVERVHIIRCVADCLSSLHDRQIFHCDVKPGNIFLYRDHWVFGDFGLSVRPGLRPLMAPDELVGTRLYIAPELEDPANLDDYDWAKCDVYSLAKTMWVILTGRKHPRPGSHEPANPSESLVALSRERPGSAALDELLFEATAPDPARRPTVAAFAEALDRWLADYGDQSDMRPAIPGELTTALGR